MGGSPIPSAFEKSSWMHGILLSPARTCIPSLSSKQRIHAGHLQCRLWDWILAYVLTDLIGTRHEVKSEFENDAQKVPEAIDALAVLYLPPDTYLSVPYLSDTAPSTESAKSLHTHTHTRAQPHEKKHAMSLVVFNLFTFCFSPIWTKRPHDTQNVHS